MSSGVLSFSMGWTKVIHDIVTTLNICAQNNFIIVLCQEVVRYSTKKRLHDVAVTILMDRCNINIVVKSVYLFRVA